MNIEEKWSTLWVVVCGFISSYGTTDGETCGCVAECGVILLGKGLELHAAKSIVIVGSRAAALNV